MTDSDVQRLGQLVRLRRTQLRIHTGKALADQAHVTPRLISDLEVGRRANFSGSTKAAIEDALMWAPGSIDNTLAGGEPTPLERTPVEKRGDKEHPNLQAGVPIEVVAESLSSLIEHIRLLEGHGNVGREMIDKLRPGAKGPDYPTDDEVATALRGANEASQELRTLLGDQIVRMIATSYAENSEDVVRLFAPLLSEVMKPPPEPSEIRRRLEEDDKRKNVTSLTDRRKVPPPPDLSDMGVAASRREKQSDRDRDEEDGK